MKEVLLCLLWSWREFIVGIARLVSMRLWIYWCKELFWGILEQGIQKSYFEQDNILWERENFIRRLRKWKCIQKRASWLFLIDCCEILREILLRRITAIKQFVDMRDWRRCEWVILCKVSRNEARCYLLSYGKDFRLITGRRLITILLSRI